MKETKLESGERNGNGVTGKIVLLSKKIVHRHQSLFIRCIICIVSILSLQNTHAQTIDSLHFLGEYTVPFDAPFRGTIIGGLSGIDYDPARGVYYLISDDRSEVNPARFYTARVYVSPKGIDSVRFTNVTTLRDKDGKPYPSSKLDPAHAPDPEALRYDPTRNRMVWSSEGERIVKPGRIVLEDPTVIAVSPKGYLVDTFAIPDPVRMHAEPYGPRQNSVFEGVAFADHYRSLYVTVEEPLYQDGPQAGLRDTVTWTRIIRYDVRTRQPVAQYAYHPEPIARPASPPDAFKINGIPDIMSLGDGKFLVLERSFSVGHLACTIRVFLTDLSQASDISGIASLKEQPPARPAVKKLLLNMDSLGIYIDNIEGVTFGPRLPNGHKTLVFVADNNFNPLQKSQFLLFEVMP